MSNTTQHFSAWIPQTIRTLRGDKTLHDVAKTAHISTSYLSDIERGRTIPSITKLDAILTALGVTMKLGYEPTPGFLCEWAYVRKSTLREIIKVMNAIDPDLEGES